MDVHIYRQIIINNHPKTTRIFVLPNEIIKYKNNNRDNNLCHIIGYNIKTNYGNTFIPVFNHELGIKRILLSKEIKEHYNLLKINILYQMGMPLIACNIINKYLTL